MTPPRRDLAAAFPLIAGPRLAELLGDHAGSSASELASLPDLDGVADAVAGWLEGHPGAALGAALPGLWHARHGPIDSGGFPRRAIAALRRLGAISWGDLIDLSPADLGGVGQFGEGCLRPLLAAAVKVAVAGVAAGGVPGRLPLVSAFAPRPWPGTAGRLVPRLELLVRWAADELGAATVGELLAALTGPGVPGDVALARDDVLAAPLAGLFLRAGRVDPLGDLTRDLCAVLDMRLRVVFQCRIAVDGNRTLQELGDEFEISRERVRQLEIIAEARVRLALRAPRFAPVAWRADSLRAALGVAAPPELAEAALDAATRGVPVGGKAQSREVLLWAAGPYWRDAETGWLLADELPGPELAQECADPDGRVDLERLRGRLAELGLTPPAIAAWLAPIGRARQFGDAWLIWSGGLPEKAARLLALWGRPASVEEIVQAVGEGHNPHSARDRLYNGEATMRVDRDRVALRSSGLEEYSSIADAIADEIARHGGSYRVAEIIPNLIAQFNARDLSIRHYLAAPMFIVKNGEVRRRTPSDPLPTAPPVTDTPNCYLLGPNTLAWRVEANADALRGSGRLFPTPIGVWLGVKLGDNVSLSTDDGPVRVTWRESSPQGPAIGSLRAQLNRAGAKLGETALVIFRRDVGTLELRRIDPASLAQASGVARVVLLTGVPAP